MKNKKLTSIFLGALISLSIVGCNKVNNSSHSNNESSFNSDSSVTSSYIDDGKMNEDKWKSIFTANNFTNLKGNQLLETSYVLGDNKESPIRTINNSKKENFDYTSSYLRNEFDYETQTISITSNDFHTYYLNSSDKSLDESTSFKAYADNLASSLKGVAKQTNEGYQINVSFASNPTEYYYLTKKSDLVVGILYSEKLAQYVYGEYIFKETNSYNLIQSLFNVYSISNFYKDITYLEDKGCYQLPTDTLSKAFKYGKKFIGDYAYIYIKNNRLDSLSFSSRLEDGNTTNIKINITGYGEATVITPTNKIECPHKYTSFKKTDNFHYYQCDLCNVVTEYVGHRYQDGVCRDCAYIETKPNEIKCPICNKLLVTLHESTATKKVISADFDDVTFTHDSATNSDIGISTVHNCNVKIIKTTEEGLIDPDCLCSIRDVDTYKIYKNNTDLVKEFIVESNITINHEFEALNLNKLVTENYVTTCSIDIECKYCGIRYYGVKATFIKYDDEYEYYEFTPDYTYWYTMQVPHDFYYGPSCGHCPYGHNAEKNFTSFNDDSFKWVSDEKEKEFARKNGRRYVSLFADTVHAKTHECFGTKVTDIQRTIYYNSLEKAWCYLDPTVQAYETEMGFTYTIEQLLDIYSYDNNLPSGCYRYFYYSESKNQYIFSFFVCGNRNTISFLYNEDGYPLACELTNDSIDYYLQTYYEYHLPI